MTEPQKNAAMAVATAIVWGVFAYKVWYDFRHPPNDFAFDVVTVILLTGALLFRRNLK